MAREQGSSRNHQEQQQWQKIKDIRQKRVEKVVESMVDARITLH